MKFWQVAAVMALGLGGVSVAADHVIMISVDGFRPAAIEQLVAAGEMKHFARLQAEGVWTHNARTNFSYTSTVPNHVSMVTGRPVEGDAGHNYTNNGTPGMGTTLHNTKNSYVSSVFDVAHDRGLATGIFRSKSKLVIIDKSYNEITGAVDITGDDDGRTKIDLVQYAVANNQAEPLVALVESDMIATPLHLAFLHLVDPDPAGHGDRWETPGYLDAMRRVDGYLGRLLDLVENNEPYAGRTTIILTADHGGAGQVHAEVELAGNYTIPFYVWGADVPRGGDLYSINSASRQDPGEARPENGDLPQPIRNGDMGNLALALLGLPAIPDSTINAAQDLAVAAPGAPQMFIRQLPTGAMQVRWLPGVSGTLQVSETLNSWQNAYDYSDSASAQRYWIDDSQPASSRFYRFQFPPEAND